jgi:hypothetical protein
MKYKKQNASIAFILLGLGSVLAQESPVVAGTNFTGSNGSVSFSVGQMLYTTDLGTNGSVAKGIQQPYEISSVLGKENFNINLKLEVYPNPVTSLLSLEIKNYSYNSLSYQLFDLNGRIIENKRIVDSITTIEVEKYPSAVYLLKVLENSNEVKIFKIIKI